MDGLRNTVPEPKSLRGFIGPGLLIGIGFVDPGNWSTGIEGGAHFGYMLVWVLVVSNIIAVLMQNQSARLGIVLRRDLAETCAMVYSRRLNTFLWLLIESAIIATDVAEVVGTAVAFQLLFGWHLIWGVLVTAMDTLLFLALSRFGMRKVEGVVALLFLFVFGSLMVDLFMARPSFTGFLSGLAPRLTADAVPVAVGILGAVVMPHNIFLHSSLVQTRCVSAQDPDSVKRAFRGNLFDTLISLQIAFVVNLSILLVSAVTFNQANDGEGATIQGAHKILGLVLGRAAPVLFALALLASGQSSTISGTMCGEIVMQGFVKLKIKPWLRRLVTRLIAIIPASVTVMVAGEHAATTLLVSSQIVLSIQLPFTLVPLLRFTSSQNLLGAHASSTWYAWLLYFLCACIIFFNCALIALVAPVWLAVLIIFFIVVAIAYVATRKIVPAQYDTLDDRAATELTLDLAPGAAVGSGIGPGAAIAMTPISNNNSAIVIE